MAPPTFGSVGTPLPGGESNGTAAIPIPSGMVAGQTALVFVYVQVTGAVTPTGTHAATMHELTPAPVVTGSQGQSLHVFWHVATGSESGTYNFSWNENSGDPWRGGIAVRFSGTDTTNPVDVFTSATLTTAGTNGPQVQVTPTGTDRRLVWAGSNWAGATWTLTPSGYNATSGPDGGKHVSNGDAIGVASVAWPTQVASGQVRGQANNSAKQTAWLIALRPPAAAAPTVGAGPDETIALGGTVDRVATENANGSTITDRGWTVQSGPAEVGDTLSDTATLSWTPTVAGTYVLQYEATNAIGTGTDTATINVAGRAGPTRFYLTNSTAPVSPAFTPSGSGGGAGGWDQTTTAIRGAASLTKSGANTSVAGTETNANTSWDVLLGQWVSPSVVNAGIVQGNYAFSIGRQASNQTPDPPDLVFHIVVKVVNSAGDTVRDYADAAAFSALWPLSMIASDNSGTLDTPVSAQVGDRIVIEIGFRAQNDVTATRSGQMRYGGTDPTDLVPNDSGSLVTSRSPWFQFDSATVAALFGNVAPTVDAGPDAPVTLGGTFSRTATEDNDGPSITSREWQIVSGPGAGTTIGNAAALSWEPAQPGVYVLRYFATNTVGTGVDDVTVTVNDPGDAPTVDAGGDADLALGDTLTRTADEDDGGSAITSRQWLLVSGPE